MKASIIKSKYIFSLTTIIIIFGVWLFLSSVVKNDYLFPTKEMMMSGFKFIVIDNFPILVSTIVKIIVGIILAFIIASIIFVIYIFNKNLIGFFTPILSFIHVVPTMGISVYLYFFFDVNIIPFILVVMLTVPIIVEGLITSYDNIDKGIVDVLKLEQISFVKKLFKVYLPLMLPYILMILLQSFSLGVKAMVMGEYICSTNNSLGFLILSAQGALQMENIIVILVVLFVISIVTEVIIKILQAKVKTYLIK